MKSSFKKVCELELHVNKEYILQGSISIAEIKKEPLLNKRFSFGQGNMITF
jgi:hypothetical protein